MCTTVWLAWAKREKQHENKNKRTNTKAMQRCVAFCVYGLLICVEIVLVAVSCACVISACVISGVGKTVYTWLAEH